MTEMSRERREELEASLVDPDGTEPKVVSVPTADLRALLRDSAWRERVEREVRELADEMDSAAAYTEDAGYNRFGDQLRAIVDTGDEEGV